MIGITATSPLVWSISLTEFIPKAIFLFGIILIIKWLIPSFTPVPVPSRPARPVGESPTSKGNGRTIPCVSPATGEVLGEVKALTKEDVAVCIAACRVAHEEWRLTSFSERSAVMYDLIEMILKEENNICKASMNDTGKTLFEAEFGEILTSCEKLRHLAKHGESYLSPSYRSAPLLLGTKSGRLEYKPMGIIGVIVPWNYPFHNVLSAAAAAIYSGNGCVIKVSEWSSFSKIRFENMLRSVLARRGHNPDLIQLIPGYGDTGEFLCRNPGIDKILFIGSPATGKKVMAAAVDNLTPVILELGGKDPMVVFDDVPLNWALSVVLRGCFINNGQNCISSERVYVHEKIYDKFAEMVVNKVKETSQGPPTEGHFDFGAMTMPGQVKIVEDLVNDAVENGAKVLAGGKRNSNYSKGNWYEPTVLSNIKHTMRIVNEEVFGPVCLLIPFSSDSELVKNINSTVYGLGCSILSANLTRGEKIGHQVKSGMCTINDYGVSYLVQGLPFGGVGDSGFGRFNGPEGLRGFCRERTVVSDRFPSMLTPVPRLIQYPVAKKAPELISAAIHAIYEPQWGVKLSSIANFVKLAISNPKQFVPA